MNARLVDGWVVVDCDAHDSAVVEISTDGGTSWSGAFRDWDGTTRVAKIPAPLDLARYAKVQARIAGTVRAAGNLT